MKSIKNKINKILKVLLSIVVLLVLGVSFFIYSSQHIMFGDYPRKLSSEKEIIEVSYIAWACDCANWLPVPRENPNKEIKAEDCIFIEPAADDLEVPDSFWKEEYFQKKLRLTGSYYKTVGVPKDYITETEIKPDKAKVFRYSKVEILSK